MMHNLFYLAQGLLIFKEWYDEKSSPADNYSKSLNN
jgi:hypothetical protein